MTAPTINITESQTLQALRTVLIGWLPAGVEVIKGQPNRVAEPAGSDFVVMTPILRERLGTNQATFTDTYPSTTQTRQDVQATRVTVQLDVHGPAAADNVQVISTLLRSEVATDAFEATGFDVAPLYAGDPRQAPFLNAEQQIETRWTLDAVMQTSPVVTTAQDFAGSLSVGIHNVDVDYPPT